MSARRRLSRMAIRGSTGHWREPNVNYVTKSGSNNFHGNALYWWNGRALNANSFFNNQNGAPRPFDNANQWAASFGGPIKKDKTFFFVDTEGLRFVLPTSTNARIPSPKFQAATLREPGVGAVLYVSLQSLSERTRCGPSDSTEQLGV